MTAHYKARLYAPHLGRFMQTDPIGYQDSPNLYNYVLGDPVNLVDPLGLDVAPPAKPKPKCPPSADIVVCGSRYYPPPPPNHLPGGGSISGGPITGPNPGNGGEGGSNGQQQKTKQCAGVGRGLSGNPGLVGKEGGIPGQTVQPGTAAVIPQQFGFSGGAQLAPYASQIHGSIGGTVFGELTDVIGGKSPTSGVPVRDALQQLFPGQLILEIPGAPDQGSNAAVSMTVPGMLQCPTGTSPTGG